jgi:hypothetical protein
MTMSVPLPRLSTNELLTGTDAPLEKKMKSTRNPLAALTIIAILFTSAVRVSVAADNKPLTKHELKELLKTAKEPPEHRRIAEYYRQEAKRLYAESKEHSELAEIYGKHQPFLSMEAKHGDTFAQGASHCRKWATLIAEQAKQAESLAALHEEMAKALEQKQ